ncbi:hypothetical protein FRC03_010937 [Tulasnella sp. 419]|nr:hypothetical protein FRC03_010937 [Tulasnella sp. 419]
MMAWICMIYLVSHLFCRTWAFGAGSIPEGSWLYGKAFRHGNIEDELERFIQDRQRILSAHGIDGANNGSPINTWSFEKGAVERIYFGNWLRDYSQLLDTKALKYFNQTILVRLVRVAGFISAGYSGGDFNITKENLGVYLPVEHIDNPKGYNNGADARILHPWLRPPVDPMELRIDYRTGMKNYISNEDGEWHTSFAQLRRQLGLSIMYGRMFAQSKDRNHKHEAYRHLGAALHTLEDFPAHSNFCELALIRLYNQSVFSFAGKDTQIMSPLGHKVFPLVTGTFSGKDFAHSVLGELSDALSQSSIRALKYGADSLEAKQKFNKIFGKHKFGTLANIQALVADLNQKAAARLNSSHTEYPTTVDYTTKHDKSIPAVRRRMWHLVRNSFVSSQLPKSKRKLHSLDFELWEDTASRSQYLHESHKLIQRDILQIGELLSKAKESATDGLPGEAVDKLISFKNSITHSVLSSAKKVIDVMVDARAEFQNLEDNISCFVMRSLADTLTPFIQISVQRLQRVMHHMLIESEQQWEVFSDPKSSDPTHSLLSKDHFANILNEPAGNIAKVIVYETANLVVKAWENPSMSVNDTVNAVLKAIFHPDFHDTSSPVQVKMLRKMEEWIGSYSDSTRKEILRRLEIDGVMLNLNLRFEQSIKTPADSAIMARSQKSEIHDTSIKVGIGDQVAGKAGDSVAGKANPTLSPKFKKNFLSSILPPPHINPDLS